MKKEITITFTEEEYAGLKECATGQGLKIEECVKIAALELAAANNSTQTLKVDHKKREDDFDLNQIEALRDIKLLSRLNDDEIKEVSKRIQIKEYKKNDTVLLQSMPNRYIFMVLSGKFKATQTTFDGKEIILSIYQPGEYFGEMSIIENKPASATIVAMEKSVAALLFKKAFYDLLPEQKSFLLGLLEVLCTRIRASNEKIELLNYTNATQRIKMLFAILSKEYGINNEGQIALNIKLTHQDIADMTGLLRVTVTKIINKWMKKGELTISEKKHISFASSFLSLEFER